jgi:hypothetical protein
MTHFEGGWVEYANEEGLISTLKSKPKPNLICIFRILINLIFMFLP